MSSESLFAFFFPFLLYLLISLVHVLLPAQKVQGYVTEKQNTGPLLNYRLNGLIVCIIFVSFFVLLTYLDPANGLFLYLNRYMIIAGSCATGLAASYIAVYWIIDEEDKVNGEAKDNTVKVKEKAPAPSLKSFGRPKNLNFSLETFYLGRLYNPQFHLFGLSQPALDGKMALYLYGAVLLQLNLLSFSWAHYFYNTKSNLNYGVFVYLFLFSFFVMEYLYFEFVHLYTYDFFAEKFGFKLIWGCMCFYPNFYAIGLWPFVFNQNQINPNLFIILLAFITFFTGWILSRGANLQKYWFKVLGRKGKFLGIEPEVITDQNNKKSLLVNGFWGLSRHINYLGEILMSLGLTISLGSFNFLALLYPFYYIALLTTRQIDDDARCALKYNENGQGLWNTYIKRVPYRIVPGIY